MRARLRLLAAGTIALSVVIFGSIGPARARSIPPPTPVPPSGSPSPFPTVLHTPAPSAAPPDLHSAAAILEDFDTGQILYAKAPNAERPVASLTKIMTAYLTLLTASPSEALTVGRDDVLRFGSYLGLRVGERITVEQLLYALLLQSANDAALPLADRVSGSVPSFVRRMNSEALAVGMRRTRFASPNGLDDNGYSTAADLATLTRLAFGQPPFPRIVMTKFHDVPAPSGPPRHIQNRNVLLWLYPGAIGVKTGFTTRAGHCLVAVARRGDRTVVAVVLGDQVEAFDDGAALLNHGFAGFNRVTLVRRGQLLGRIRVGASVVDAVAASDLVRLVRRDRLGPARTTFLPDRGIGPSIASGQAVGRALVSVGGRSIGWVTAVAEVPAAPRLSGPPEAGGYVEPIRAVTAVFAAVAGSVLGRFL